MYKRGTKRTKGGILRKLTDIEKLGWVLFIGLILFALYINK